IDQIAQLALQARLLNDVLGADAGGGALAEALAGVLREDRALTLATLAQALGAMEQTAGQPEICRGAAAETAGVAHSPGSIMQCLGTEQSAELMLLIEDVASRLARGEAPANAMLAATMQFAVEAVASEVDQGRDLDARQAADLTQRVRE